MLSKKLFFPLLLVFIFISCKKEDATDGQNESPTGNLTVSRSGNFQSQNGYIASGTAEIGLDQANTQWLRFADNFTASLSTGAVTVYLSKNQNLSLNNSGTFVRLQLVTTPGEKFFKVDPAVGEEFQYAILWCASASVQFGNAPLTP